jgi:hypothetical protein
MSRETKATSPPQHAISTGAPVHAVAVCASMLARASSHDPKKGGLHSE